MKKVLVILGHPNKDSFNSFLANSLVDGLVKKNNEVKRINLGDLNFDLNLKKGYKEIQELEGDLKKSQEDILWADYLIFVFPIWWYNIPAILKGFIDRVFLPGFAFKYTNSMPKKLLKGKKSAIICTSGDSSIAYFFIGNSAAKNLSSSLAFCGIKNIKTQLFGLVEKRVNVKGLDFYKKRLDGIIKLIK
ncbi:MAG: NAD(P)H-dependent oxidoreductase [Patescibacteria group bacterium]